MAKRFLGILSLLFILLFSCRGAFAEDSGKPEGDDSALAVYFQAYQENYEPDSMDMILSEAKNAYVLIDPFDPDIPVTSEQIELLRSEGNMVSAYISIGTGEAWRSDFEALKPWLAEKQWGDWEGEYYVSRLEKGLVQLMKDRIDRAYELGFNWLEFDNMDWIFDPETRKEYALEAGEAEGEDYLRELYDYGASRGMKCMSKNTREHAGFFDGVTWESYSNDKNWWDSGELRGFLNEGKPVIIVHYGERNSERAYRAYNWYMDLYGPGISFIAETRKARGYIHFNDE